MSTLESYLETFGPLSQASRETLNGFIELEQFKKGDFLWRTGDRCDKIFFLNQGLVRLYFFDEKGNEVTVHFVGKGKLISDPESLNAGSPSAVSACVEMTTDVTTLNKTALARLEQDFFQWSLLLRKVTEKLLFEKVKLRNRLFQAGAKERFEIFLAEFPGVANHAKAADVASFLGISQYTLSHLKKEMVKNDSFKFRSN